MKNQPDNCDGCSQKERCGQVFGNLGKGQGPNVTWPVILAFLVPILVFIGALAGATKLLEGRIEGNLLTAVVFAAALVPTLATILGIRMVRKRVKK